MEFNSLLRDEEENGILPFSDVVLGWKLSSQARGISGYVPKCLQSQFLSTPCTITYISQKFYWIYKEFSEGMAHILFRL